MRLLCYYFNQEHLIKVKFQYERFVREASSMFYVQLFTVHCSLYSTTPSLTIRLILLCTVALAKLRIVKQMRNKNEHMNALQNRM